MNLCNFFFLGNSSYNFIIVRDWKPLLSTVLPIYLWSVSHSACAAVFIRLILNIPGNGTSRLPLCHNCSVKKPSVRNLLSCKRMHFLDFPSLNNVQSYCLCGYSSSAFRLLTVPEPTLKHSFVSHLSAHPCPWPVPGPWLMPNAWGCPQCSAPWLQLWHGPSKPGPDLPYGYAIHRVS